MMEIAKPYWVFDLWCSGMADLYVASDKELPIHPVRRVFLFVRGYLLAFLFQWWWFTNFKSEDK